jgi:hypothetical protein
VELDEKRKEAIDCPMDNGNDDDWGAGRHVYSNPIDPYVCGVLSLARKFSANTYNPVNEWR